MSTVFPRFPAEFHRLNFGTGAMEIRPQVAADATVLAGAFDVVFVVVVVVSTGAAKRIRSRLSAASGRNVGGV